MKDKGFSLIELMISITIMAVFFVGATVYYNNFITRQKLDKTKAEIESMIKLASNYARTKQSPVGYNSEVLFTTLLNNSGKLAISVNGTGTTYISNKISEDSVTVTFNPPSLYFWGGSGQLSNNNKPNNPDFFDSNQKADIKITISQGVAETRTIFIDSLGNIQ